MHRLNSLKVHFEKIGLFQTFFYLLQRIFLRKGHYIKLKIPGLENPVFLRNKYYDTHIFNQIFIRDEVNFGYTNDPKIIVDCGANIGLSTLYFKRQFPNSHIISIEPEFSNFNLMKKNTKNYNKINCLHAAVWNQNTKVNVIDTGEGVASFITKEVENTGNIIEQTNAFTLTEIISKFNISFIDLVKMDIEGSEYELFDYKPEAWTERINMLALELHENLKPGVTKLIKSKMDGKFINYQVGEYCVFKRK